jgi:hypothetical protein
LFIANEHNLIVSAGLGQYRDGNLFINESGRDLCKFGLSGLLDHYYEVLPDIEKGKIQTTKTISSGNNIIFSNYGLLLIIAIIRATTQPSNWSFKKPLLQKIKERYQ